MKEQSLLTNTIIRVVDLLEDEIDERKRKGLTTREFELATNKLEEAVFWICYGCDNVDD